MAEAEAAWDVLRKAAAFLETVRGEPGDGLPDEHLAGYDDAVTELRQYADHLETRNRSLPPDSSNYPPVTGQAKASSAGSVE